MLRLRGKSGRVSKPNSCAGTIGLIVLDLDRELDVTRNALNIRDNPTSILSHLIGKIRHRSLSRGRTECRLKPAKIRMDPRHDAARLIATSNPGRQPFRDH